MPAAAAGCRSRDAHPSRCCAEPTQEWGRGVGLLVLQGGRIIAQGSHAELLDTGGWYAEQWQAKSELHDMAALLPTLPVGIAVPGPIR